MILNTSRGKQFQECRQKAWNWHELRLMSWREADALMTGEAFHVGIAHYFASQDVDASVRKAEARYRERLEGQMILPEEQVVIERQIELSKRMILEYTKYYKGEAIQILQPEVKFMIELPDTKHHCWFVHRLLHPNFPDNFCDDPKCEHPHYFTGRTDAVISWNNLIWLLEHKTAVNTGDIFYKRFKIDLQTTGYIYGIWKALGIRPHGFLLNVVKKPRKDVAQRDPFAISFEREPFIRDDKTLEDFEGDFIKLANDYEHAFATGNIYKNPSSCTNYNRECYYLKRCENHQQSEPDEFRLRARDYVDLEYYKLLGLEVPKDLELDAISVSEAAQNLNQ